MKLLSTLIFNFCLISCSFSQSMDWENLTAFRLYENIYVKYEQHLTLDTLKHRKYVTVNLKEAKSVLRKASLRKGLFLWKGHHLAVATFKNGKSYLMKISRYGGVFRIKQKNYLFSRDNRIDWEVLINKYRKILESSP